MNMKTVFFVLLCICNSFALVKANPDYEMVGEILNKASNQQLLSQRICKAYFAILLDLDKENQMQQMQTDISTFEENQKSLKTRLPDQSILNALENVDVIWLEFKPLLQSQNVENAGRLIKSNNSLYRVAGTVVTQIQEYGKKFSSNAEQGNVNSSYQQTLQLVAYSGEERTLAQCILALILAQKLNLSQSKEEMSKAVNRFSQLLKNLENAIQNSPEIDYTLVRLANDWKRFETLVSNPEQISKEGLIDLISLSDVLVDGMNEITRLYEEQIDAQLTSLIFNEIIDKANQQTSLCQQIANIKLREQMGSKTNTKELKTAIESFNKNHTQLKEFAILAQTEKELAAVEELWKKFGWLANQPSSQENCTELLSQNTRLYEACQEAANAIENFAGKNTIRYNSAFSNLVYQAHRQRSLSQRVILYCLAAKGNFKTQYAEEYLAQASEEYTTTLIALIAIPQNTPEISEKLNKAYKNWEKIAKDCEKSTIVKFDTKGDDNIESNKLIADMEEIAKLYQQLVDNMLLDEAINKAGRQRMLSQRLCKTYIAILMDVDADNQRKQLAKDIVLFESQLNELRTFVSNDELKSAFEQVVRIWKNYKPTLQQTPSKEGMDNLLAINTDLLNSCHQTVLLLEKNNKSSKFSNIINVAGRQRMLSQRFMMYYLAYQQSGKKNNAYLSSAIKTLTEFESGLDFLANQKVNNKTTNNKISDIRRQCDKITRYKNDLTKVDFYQVWLVVDILLAESESLTKNYERLAGR